MAWPPEQEEQIRLVLTALEMSRRGFFLLQYRDSGTRVALYARLKQEFANRKWQSHQVAPQSRPQLASHIADKLAEFPADVVLIPLEPPDDPKRFFRSLNLQREALHDLNKPILFLISHELHPHFLQTARDLVTWIAPAYVFALSRPNVPDLPAPFQDVPPDLAGQVNYYRERVQERLNRDEIEWAYEYLLPDLADAYKQAKMYDVALQIYHCLVEYHALQSNDKQRDLFDGRARIVQGWQALSKLMLGDISPQDGTLLRELFKPQILSFEKIGGGVRVTDQDGWTVDGFPDTLPPLLTALLPQVQASSILIVTVTKVEARAVLDVFSQAAGTRWTRQVTGKKTYYNLGDHGGVPVFMVQSEMGSATPGGALLTVRQAIQDLHPQAVIMCGIAFGLHPNKQHLGDILVAKQIQYYEPRKIDLRRGQIPRGDRATSAERLLDRFRSGDLDWQGAPTHFGLVLSGEKLVNDPTFRNRLLEIEPEAVGGEMEGVGLYFAARDAKVDWILVKAICDWADGVKNDDAHILSANNAAQFVLHVLQLGGWDEG